MFTQLISWQNLLLAFYKACKGKRKLPCVAEFEYKLELNLIKLIRELKDKTYRPGKYNSFYIHEPKKRLISAAPFRDRVVHHALCNIIQPVFEKGFISDSYANRENKGTHLALNRCQYFMKHFRYVLQCDIRQFFPGIDHSILYSIICNKIHDPDVLWLVMEIINSGTDVLKKEYEMVYFPGDDLFAVTRNRGLPIGNLTSQFWANVYLTPFDYFVKRELGCKGYIRYVDDFLLFSNDKKQLHHWNERINDRLERYRLIVHEGAHPKMVTEGIPFLGFNLFPDHRRLKRRKGIFYMRKLKNMIKEFNNDMIGIDSIVSSLQGWANHLKHANTAGLRNSVIKTINENRDNEQESVSSSIMLELVNSILKI